MDAKSMYKLWALSQYHLLYCDAAGQPSRPFRLEELERQLKTKQPPNDTVFQDVRDELDIEILKTMCQQHTTNIDGSFTNPIDVILALNHMRPDLADKMMIGQAVAKLEEVKKKTIISPPSHNASRSISPLSGSHGSDTTSEPDSFQKSSSSTCSTPTFTPEATQCGNRSHVPSQAEPKISTSLIGSTNQVDVPPLLSASDAAELFVLAQLECDKHSWTEANRTHTREKVISALLRKQPNTNPKWIDNAVSSAEMKRRLRAEKLAAVRPPPAKVVAPLQASTASKSRDSQPEVNKAWVYQQYLIHGFGATGFKGYTQLALHLKTAAPAGGAVAAVKILKTLRKTGELDVMRDVQDSRRARQVERERKISPSATINDGNRNICTLEANLQDRHSSISGSVHAEGGESNASMLAALSQPTTHKPVPVDTIRSTAIVKPHSDLLARQLEGLQACEVKRGSENGPISAAEEESMDLLLPADSEGNTKNGDEKERALEVQHAPLIIASALFGSSHNHVPQYGLLGSYKKEKMFLNTNIPFSAFVCGVQGSGKSHTTACMLENALIPSTLLGRLQRPLSALVFSYGQFGGDGSGFSVSEAAFLGAPHSTLPTQLSVRKVHVLVSPSNYIKMARLYSRIPGVTVSAFKLKASNLDIDIMLTLMNVSESDEQPLYMAAVNQILREMATAGGPFNYLTFRARLKQCRFNPAQTNMLQMRLGLLESFLDLNNSCPERRFAEGEITIMDMSCPFVDANTACILFRIGLQRYLQSGSTGKMVVLDEAHKYMLPNPGAKALNETLLTTIRLQRHYGARVIVSTQEPTLLTDLIALCSITVIHRFSSPEWFAAIKRHIPINAADRDTVMRTIEGLKTGSALVYSSNAILGQCEDGTLLKGAGKLLEIKIRKRVTSDGGQSVLAV